MKQVYLFLVLIITCWGCQDMKVGYLKAENAGYLPNELEVKKTLDPVEDAVRMANEAPWVTQKIQGVLGTSPLSFEFVSVKASEGGDAEVFKKEIQSVVEELWSYRYTRNYPWGVMSLP